jgi:hypothetical protein
MPVAKAVQYAMRALCPWLLCLIVGSLAGPGSACASENLIENSGFETEVLGNLAMWSMHAATDTEDAVRFFSTDADAHSGKRSFAIANLKPNDAWAVQWVKVKPNTIYRLSCWIQARNVMSETVGANISVLGSARAAGDLKDTRGNWQLVRMYGKTGPDQRSLGVLVRLGFYQSPATGLALFDDVDLEELPVLPAGAGQDIVNFSVNEYRTDTVTAGQTLTVQRSGGSSSLGDLARVPIWLFITTLAALAAAVVLLAFFALRFRHRVMGTSVRLAGRAAGAYTGVEHRGSARSTLLAEVTLKRTRRGGMPDVFHFSGGNISEGGIFLECHEPSTLRLNDEARLEVILPTDKLTLGKAVVTRVRSHTARSGKLVSEGLGLRFLTASTRELKDRRRAPAVPAGARTRGV